MAYYQQNYPEVASAKSAEIAAAGDALGELYTLNVFPDMEVWWNTYPEHSGHQSSEGCFRCHGRRLRSDDRETISSDCSLCHTVLAEEESDPEILGVLNP